MSKDSTEATDVQYETAYEEAKEFVMINGNYGVSENIAITAVMEYILYSKQLYVR